MGENIGHGYNGQKTTTKNTSSRNIQKNYKSVRKIKTTQSKKKADLNRYFTFTLDIYVCLQQYFNNIQKLVTAQMSRLQINKQVMVYSFN